MAHNYQPPPPRRRKRRSGVQIVGFFILAGAIVAAAAGGIFAAIGSRSSHSTPACSTLVGQSFAGPSAGGIVPPVNCSDGGKKVVDASRQGCLYFLQLQSGLLVYAVPGGVWQSVPSPLSAEIDPQTEASRLC